MILRKTTLASFAIIWLFSLPGRQITAAETEGEIMLRVSSNGNSIIRHPIGYPLVIEVTLSNPTSGNLILDAIAAQAAQKKSGPSQSSNTETNIPVVVVGSTDKPAATAISFSITGAKKTGPHMLAESKKAAPSSVRLDGHQSLTARYGFDAADLPGKAVGHIEISAKLDPASIVPKGAIVSSKSLKIEFIKANELKPARKIAADYAAGRYFIIDEKYQDAAPYADALEKNCPQLAAVLRAEMYYGLGDVAKAREACRRALTLYAQNVKGETDAEPPIYLFELLKQIDETKR